MHKTYINDKPILFWPVYDASHIPEVPHSKIVSESEVSLESVIKDLERKKELSGIIYLCDSPDTCWNYFTSLFRLVPAAGGLVQNENGEYLLIFRRGKWDLPKGKIDYDESPEEAALREVEEECGVKGLKIVKELPATFHTYPENGKRMLKKTNWYLMETDSSDKLIPQAEEDIEKAEWMNLTRMKSELKKNSYNSLREFIWEYLESKP